MPQSKITVNGVPGSNIDLPINSVVALDNQNSGGELTYAWSILDQPPGATDSLSSLTIQDPSFTPKKEGSYLIRLIVNQGYPTEQENRVICAVAQLKTLERVPAAGETTESDSADGWATSQNSYLRRIDTLLGDPGIIVGVNASSPAVTLTRGEIVRATSAPHIKVSLPGEEVLPGFDLAPATLLGNVDELLCVVEGAVDGTPSVPGTGTTEQRLMKVRYIGRLEQINVGASVVVGQTLFCSDTGAIATTQGTIRRRIGSAMTAGTVVDVWFNGVGGADIDQTPIDRRYVVYGALGALPNGFRVDGTTNASGVTGGVPWCIKQGDTSTVGLIVQRFLASTQDLQQWQSETGTVLAKMSSTGGLTLANGLVVSAGGITVNAGNVTMASGLSFTMNPGVSQFLVNNSSVYLNQRRVYLSDVDSLANYFEYSYVAGPSSRGISLSNQSSGGFAVTKLQTAGVENQLILGGTTGGTCSIVNNQGELRFDVTGSSNDATFSMGSDGEVWIVGASNALWKFASYASGGALIAYGTYRAIQNVLDPVNDQDAATKKYVNDRIALRNTGTHHKLFSVVEAHIRDAYSYIPQVAWGSSYLEPSIQAVHDPGTYDILWELKVPAGCTVTAIEIQASGPASTYATYTRCMKLTKGTGYAVETELQGVHHSVISMGALAWRAINLAGSFSVAEDEMIILAIDTDSADMGLWAFGAVRVTYTTTSALEV